MGMVAILVNGPNHFSNLSFLRSREDLSKIGSAASELLFENVNGQTHTHRDDRQRVITIAHPVHTSGELTSPLSS